MSATGPQVFFPAMMPARRYPTRAGILTRSARYPKTSARPKAMARVEISGRECSMGVTALKKRNEIKTEVSL